MPIYEYQCTNCGSEFEKMVRFSEANKNPECPYCASGETHKKVSLFSSQGSSFGGSSFGTGSSCGSSGSFS